MSTPFSDLESEALKLPRAERARLADRLLASVHGDSAIDDAWAAEVAWRIEEIESGAPLIAGETAIARARRSLIRFANLGWWRRWGGSGRRSDRPGVAFRARNPLIRAGRLAAARPHGVSAAHAFPPL